MSTEQRWRVAPDPGLVVQRTCDHLADLAEVPADTPLACQDCLRNGTTWVHLRACLHCGHIGCCDSSRGRHAFRHAHAEHGHHLARSVEPGEQWAWCYTDELFLRPA